MNNFVSLPLFVILILLNDSVQCYKCNFFNNIKIEVTPTLNNLKRKIFPTVNGCFEPDQFRTEVEAIAVEKKNIGILGDHAVRDLSQLKSLSFFNCDIRQISPNAFANLPNLQEIWVTESKLTSIESGTFKYMTNLEIIVLDVARISKIAKDAFGEGLRELSVEENRLEEINHLWFINSSELISLSFKCNKIREINRRTFQFTPNLVFLDLSQNEIRNIDGRTFFHLKKMDVLNLGYNRIVELESNIVADNFKIKKIDLSCNFLNFLPQGLLNKITVKTMVLSGNPWDCSCLEQIHKWITKLNIDLLNYCKLNHAPYCIQGKPDTVCSEKADLNVTESFLKVMKKHNDHNCANLS